MSRTEALTRQFYAWERKGRGWDMFPFPVSLEPPFQYFRYHEVPGAASGYVDDSKRHTLASWIFSGFQSNAKRKELPEPSGQPNSPIRYAEDHQLISLAVSLPQNHKVRMEEMEQLLTMLSQTQFHISFEIIGTSEDISIQFVCREPDAEHVHSMITAYFPENIIVGTYMDRTIPDDMEGFVIDFGLREEFMRPLAMPKGFDLDPLIGLFGILEYLTGSETAILQIQFKGVENPWAESILNAVRDNSGDSFFADAPDMVKLAEQKILSPLFAATVRVIGFSTKDETSLANRLSAAIQQATYSTYNELARLDSEGYEPEDYCSDIIYRQSHRTGMLLNSRELATLVHFPSPSVVSKKLLRDTRKSKEPSEIYLGHTHILGTNINQGVETEMTVSPGQRLKHTHVIGATGTGKSTLLFSSIIQDIARGEGVAVLDPHGDLIESVLSWIHPDRHKDVILIDPADAEFPVGFNILTAHSEIEKDILSSDLVAVFRRLSTSWGDQMNSVFANAILAFLESEKGGTLVDLRRFLIEKSFRDQFLKTVSDPSIVYYWQKEFPILKSSSIGPILTRLDSFLRPKLIRNMVAQNKSLDFEDILDSKKILLVKLSQGLMGNENSFLLGSFIVSKIQQAAMARQAKQKADRSNFYLYIDEFQNFITPSMSAILSGARKYHLGLILAHQDMQQLNKEDSELASSVIANAGTRICFRLGDTDAKKFESGFSYFDAMDLQNLRTGEAIIRIERPENDCNMQTLRVDELDVDTAQQIKKMVIAASRAAYGTPKAEVEALLRSLHEVAEEPEAQYKLVKRNTVRTTEPSTPIHEEKPLPILKETQPRREPNNPEIKKQETQHRYLQTLIKKMAESRGYKAVMEEPTPSGGRVDVGLLKGSSKIAVEISVTTPDTWEIQNIQKCFLAGYNPVVVCSADRKHLEKIQKFVENTLEPIHLPNVLFYEPEALFLYLDQQTAKEMSGEERVKGYRVKVEYDAVSDTEAKQKQASILKAVSDASRKGKK